MKASWMAKVSGAALAVLLAAPAVAARSQGPKVHGVLNLNEASPAQLGLLPGMSGKAAQGILDYRKQHPFQRPEELVKVKGFGKKRFDRLKPFLTVQGATTLQRAAAEGRAKGKKG